MAKDPKNSSAKRGKRPPHRRVRKTKVGKQNSSRERYDARLEDGLKQWRSGDSLAIAARQVGSTPSRLRRYAEKTGIVSRRNGKWVFKRDRRFRRMPVYSGGQRFVVTVRNGKSASRIGEYMNAVGQFFETEDIDLLAPFRGDSVKDVEGKRYVFETRPNVLFRLDASGVEPFELVYAIVKPE